MMEFLTVGNALLAALAVAGGFGWRWVDRLQQQQDKQAQELGALWKKLLEEYAKRSDVTSGDEKILERIKEVFGQLQRINDKLDGKKDKSDG